MEKYIPKSVLTVEIERRLDELYELLPDASKVENGMITISEACNTGKYTALESFRRFLDTIQMKEVNLEKEYKEYVVDDPMFSTFILNDTFGRLMAKHFFELGLKTQKL